MTNLTNLAPASSYGDILTTTNNGLGLNAILNPIQDGLGNQSILRLSTLAFNIDTSSGVFQINGTALTATATQINTVCGANTFPGTSGMIVPSGTTAQRPGLPTNGTIRYNTTTSRLEAYANNIWQDLTV